MQNLTGTEGEKQVDNEGIGRMKFKGEKKQMKRSFSKLVSILVGAVYFAFILMAEQFALAAAPSQQLTIKNVSIDFVTDTITITGENISLAAPTVTLGAGNISQHCAVVATPRSIVCNLLPPSGPGIPPNGDYRLVVA